MSACALHFFAWFILKQWATIFRMSVFLFYSRINSRIPVQGDGAFRTAQNRRAFVLQRRPRSYLSRDANRYLAFDPGQRHALQEIALREKEDGNHW
jgi:hypothetical protein